MRWLLIVAVLASGCRFRFDELPSDAQTGDAGPTPTCAGHDEDRDTFPDVCDVCPTVADGAQHDGDGDGVGDACDPRPATPGDYVLRFEPHTDRASAQYLREFNTVEWRGDAIRLGTLTDAGSVTYRLDAYPARLSAGTRVIAVSGLQLWFGFWYSQSTTEDPKIFASAAHVPSDSNVYFALKDQAGPGDEMFCPDKPAGPPAFSPGDSYTFIVDTELVTGGMHHIEVRSPTETWACSMMARTPSFNGGFLEAVRVIVEFDYFIAYGIR